MATLGQQVRFREELEFLTEEARRTPAGCDPVRRDKIARARIGLEVMRAHALRTMAAPATSGAEEGVVRERAPRRQ